MSLEITFGFFAAIAVVSFLCEYMDATLGAGYGTTLTPLLLIVGFLPLEVVPAVLLGQFVGGMSGGLAHHRFGNINLDFRRDDKYGTVYVPRSLDAKIIFILVIFGVIGGLIGALSAVNIPSLILKIYVGAVVLGAGIVILVRLNHKVSFSWRGIIGIGLLSAFNKGISGGGYGPLVSGGQIINGRGVKESIGSTTMAEVAICAVAFLTYMMLLNGGIYWGLAAATSIGSIIAGPLAAFTVKKAESKRLKLIIGLFFTVLGVLALARFLSP